MSSNPMSLMSHFSIEPPKPVLGMPGLRMPGLRKPGLCIPGPGMAGQSMPAQSMLGLNDRYYTINPRQTSQTNMEIDIRGIQFIIENKLRSSGITAIANGLNNLTTLNIGNQLNDSDNNSIEDLDATAIATYLKNLTTLSIRKQLNDLGSNNIGR
jgi:hypothetical protein